MANFYHGQHQFNISTAEFNTYNIKSIQNEPYQVLCRARAIEATDISNVAVYAPKCSPGSRTKTLDDIMAWVHSPTSAILWISGIAGAGKTCVMREVVKRCHEAGLVTWTYFFNFRHPRLQIEQPFVATLVSQMIDTIPPLRPVVLQALENDPDIFNANISLDHQMKTLLLPALDLPPFQADPAAPPKIAILVDAIDECSEKRERGHLLRLLHFLTQRKRPTIVVIVASRPEPDLRTAYDTPVLKSATTHLRLEKYDTANDVRHLLCDEFEKIRNTHPMAVPEDWPDEATLSRVEAFCSGTLGLMMASMITRYTGKPNNNPVDALNAVLALTPPSDPTANDPSQRLDGLYFLILHPPDADMNLIKRIVHTTAVLTGSGSSTVRLKCLDALLDVAPETCTSIARELSPVIDSSQGRFNFRHKSLRDYLLTEDRARDLFRPRSETHLEIATAVAEKLQRWYNGDPTEPHPIGWAVLQWAVSAWESKVLELPMDQLPTPIRTFDPRIVFCYAFMARTVGGWPLSTLTVTGPSWTRLIGGDHLHSVSIHTFSIDCY